MGWGSLERISRESNAMLRAPISALRDVGSKAIATIHSLFLCPENNSLVITTWGRSLEYLWSNRDTTPIPILAARNVRMSSR